MFYTGRERFALASGVQMANAAARTWRHRSVLALGPVDPVDWVISRARELVFRAIEAGWSGPPFNPAELADLLHVEVRPSQEILDARLVPDSRRARIEFNPNRPPGRIRYSIAHEIGHTLFADYAEVARHRLAAPPDSADAELEMLCNIAAAEILMPIGSFGEIGSGMPTIDGVLRLRAAFDLSLEAVLLRTARLSEYPLNVFVAAPLGETAADGYEVDYSVAAGPGRPRLPRGLQLPRASVVGECTAVGFTAKRVERWPGLRAAERVEAVGLPPYPGRVLPRVAGLLLPEAPAPRLPAIRYLVGDATKPRGDGLRIVMHVANDATSRWGGGFAREVRRQWPRVQADFASWAGGHPPVLGAIHISEPEPWLAIATMVAQHGYGPSSTPRLRYAYLERCLDQVADVALERGATVHAPRIGAGEAGGKWEIIAELIDEALVQRGIDVTVYDLPTADRGASRTTGY